MPEGFGSVLRLGPDARLVVAAANASRGGTTDFSIELLSANGQTASVPLSRAGFLAPAAETPLWNSLLLDRFMVRGPEHVLQSFEIPLAQFVDDNPGFDPYHVTGVRFRFDRVPAGVVLVDDVGFRSSIPRVSSAISRSDLP